VFAPPAVAGDLVFIGSCSGTFYALDRLTGDLRWSYDIRRDGKQLSFHGAMFTGKNTVMFGTDHACAPGGIGHVYAAAQDSGEILWKYRSPVGISSNLVRTRSAICFGTNSGQWGCLDAGSGRLRWMTTPVPASTGCEMPIWADSNNDTVFIVARDGAVVALRALDGKVRWTQRLGARATTSPVVSRGQLYVGAADKRVYTLESKTGHVVRSVDIGAEPFDRPAITERALYFLTRGEAVPKGGLVALDLPLTEMRWSQAHQRTFDSGQPHIWRDMVVVADCAGEVQAFARSDGALRWKMNVNGCIRSIGTSGDLLFLGAQEGMVYAIQP
jgi:eukaryotic-like serine/threonine-protein kinase